VAPQAARVQNIEFETGPGRYLICCLVKFPVECRQNYVWDPFLTRVMTIILSRIFIKNLRCFNDNAKCYIKLHVARR
jgi:hypothetical protein